MPPSRFITGQMPLRMPHMHSRPAANIRGRIPAPNPELDMVTPPQSLAGRLVLLAVCLGIGAAIAAGGHHLTGDQRWFLAIPGCLALGWLLVGDPEKCMSERCRRE